MIYYLSDINFVSLWIVIRRFIYDENQFSNIFTSKHNKGISMLVTEAELEIIISDSLPLRLF